MTMETEVNEYRSGPVSTNANDTQVSPEVAEMIEPFDLGEMNPELLAIGNYRAVSLQAKRTGEGIAKIAEALADHFANSPQQHVYPVNKLPIELSPADRKEVVIWLEDHVPLADDAYKWTCGFNGHNDGFELAIKKRIVRTAR